jgi:hypothetical protein
VYCVFVQDSSLSDPKVTLDSSNSPDSNAIPSIDMDTTASVRRPLISSPLKRSVSTVVESGGTIVGVMSLEGPTMLPPTSDGHSRLVLDSIGISNKAPKFIQHSSPSSAQSTTCATELEKENVVPTLDAGVATCQASRAKPMAITPNEKQLCDKTAVASTQNSGKQTARRNNKYSQLLEYKAGNTPIAVRVKSRIAARESSSKSTVETKTTKSNKSLSRAHSRSQPPSMPLGSTKKTRMLKL